MRSQNVLLSLLHGPITVVSEGAFEAVLVSVFYASCVFFWHAVAVGWLGEEESVVGLTGRVALWLEECIEIPE